MSQTWLPFPSVFFSRDIFPTLLSPFPPDMSHLFFAVFFLFISPLTRCHPAAPAHSRAPRPRGIEFFSPPPPPSFSRQMPFLLSTWRCFSLLCFFFFRLLSLPISFGGLLPEAIFRRLFWRRLTPLPESCLIFCPPIVLLKLTVPLFLSS